MSRSVVVHFHLFKNAGTSVEASLKRAFGRRRWVSFEGPTPGHRLTGADLVALVAENVRVKAVSSHQLQPPLQPVDGLTWLPLVFLRHPIDRIRSAYQFERGQLAKSSHTSANAAATMSFADWIQFHRERGGAHCANFQVMALSEHRWPDGRPVAAAIEDHLDSATGFLRSIPEVGLVERYEDSLERIGRSWQPTLGQVELVKRHRNRSKVEGDLAGRIDAVRRQLGDAAYRELVAANAADFELYRRFST